MPFDAPFMLGPFAVDAMGRLAPRGPDSPPGFFFHWRGRMIRARFEQTDPDLGRLVLQATLGRVPSTASPRDRGLRGQSFQLLRLLPRALPEPWQLLLLPDHRVQLEADSRVTVPVTATDLLVGITRFLLELAPYLDLLDEAGIAGAPAEPGSANT
ncbi:MAG TPA: hypothetical protein VND19_15755 [Acetobacteraceae bacterium]|nr:hypothetical protein [Acetobacteraceae bacterium]